MLLEISNAARCQFDTGNRSALDDGGRFIQNAEASGFIPRGP